MGWWEGEATGIDIYNKIVSNLNKKKKPDSAEQRNGDVVVPSCTSCNAGTLRLRQGYHKFEASLKAT